jgi:hypothetical protein
MHRQPVEKGTKGAVDVGLAWQSHLWASGRPGSVAPTRIALSLFSVFVKSNESKIKKIKRIEVQSSPAKKEKTNRSSKREGTQIFFVTSYTTNA